MLSIPRPDRVQRFAVELRELRRQAGNPGYRELARRAGFSVTTLSEAAGGRHLPAIRVVQEYAAACDGDPDIWAERWRTAAAELADLTRQAELARGNGRAQGNGGPSAAVVAVGGAAAEITMWDLRRRVRIGRLTGHSGPAAALRTICQTLRTHFPHEPPGNCG